MKRVRFYRDGGNVIAVVDGGAYVPLYDYANSPVCWASVSAKYLSGCEKIKGHTARIIHPRLFARMDNDSQEKVPDEDGYMWWRD